MSTMLSRHITQEQFEFSSTGSRHEIQNHMNDIQLAYAKGLCTDILDVLWEYYGGKLHIDSGFRNPQVNALVGGVATSQHCKGQAADIIVIGHTVEDVFQTIKNGIIKIQYDQLIQEFGGWVHISYVKSHCRKQALRATVINGMAHYAAA